LISISLLVPALKIKTVLSSFKGLAESYKLNNVFMIKLDEWGTNLACHRVCLLKCKRYKAQRYFVPKNKVISESEVRDERQETVGELKNAVFWHVTPCVS
jgi:hypothetical protein